MRKTFLVTATIALLFIGSLAEAYTFDTDNAGWQQGTVGYGQLSYETLLANQPADWTNAYGVGSPEGSLYQTSTGWENRAYWLGTKDITAADSLGDLTGETLGTYVRSTGNWAGRVNTDTVYARWTIAEEDSSGLYNMWVSKADYSIDLDVLMDYTTFGLAILPTAMGSDDLSNFDGTSGTWGSNNTLLHYGATEMNGSSATWGVDNFETSPVPEPSTILLLGGGLAGLAFYRRKKK